MKPALLAGEVALRGAVSTGECHLVSPAANGSSPRLRVAPAVAIQTPGRESNFAVLCLLNRGSAIVLPRPEYAARASQAALTDLWASNSKTPRGIKDHEARGPRKDHERAPPALLATSTPSSRRNPGYLSQWEPSSPAACRLPSPTPTVPTTRSHRMLDVGCSMLDVGCWMLRSARGDCPAICLTGFAARP